MFAWLNRRFDRWRRDTSGVMAIEFGVMLPLLLTVLVFMFELGNVFYDTTLIRKGMRAGAMYAARQTLGNLIPTLDSTVQQNIEDMIMFGKIEPVAGDPFIVRGWSTCSGCITFAINEETFTGTDGVNFDLQVITLTAKVIYTPLFPGLLFSGGKSGKDLTIFPTIGIGAFHEQVHIGL